MGIDRMPKFQVMPRLLNTEHKLDVKPEPAIPAKKETEKPGIPYTPQPETLEPPTGRPALDQRLKNEWQG